MCPWGCFEFQHKVAYVPLDMAFQKYLPRCHLKLINSPNLLQFVVSARKDYIRGEGDEDHWHFNPEKEILPSISMVNGMGPCVLTCKDHNHGSKLHMIHPCRLKHNLASKIPDQLCQAVIRPRVVKPVQVSTYCSSFQMI